MPICQALIALFFIFYYLLLCRKTLTRKRLGVSRWAIMAQAPDSQAVIRFLSFYTKKSLELFEYQCFTPERKSRIGFEAIFLRTA